MVYNILVLLDWQKFRYIILICLGVLSIPNVYGQNSCPDADSWEVTCDSGNCPTGSGMCSYTGTFATNFTGSGGKYVVITVYINGQAVQVNPACIGPLDGKVVNSYAVTFSGPCSADIQATYAAYTASNQCAGGTTCGSGACYSDGTCQEGGLLPITLSAFSATLNVSLVDLVWVTTSEIDSDMFMVEKSLDGAFFRIIGEAKAAGNSSENVVYDFQDEHPNYGTNFYRLKQVDLDGSFTYSKIVKVDYQPDHMLIFPNPVEKVLNITEKNADDFEILRITDLSGRMISNIPLKNIESNSTISVDVGDLPSGTYLTQLVSSDNSVSRIFVKN